jgi:tetratricopeptide (TPR) repeat protein
MALVRQKKLADAVPILRKAAELDSHEDQLFRAWGAYYLEDGDLKRAAAYYQKALDILYPHGPGLFEGDPDYATLAGIYAKLGDHSAALAAFRESCFAYVCPDDETYYRYGVEMKAAGLRDELRDLVDSAELGHEAVAKRLRELSAAR